MIAAAPIPAPIHILIKPNLAPYLFNSGKRVATYLAPVQPNGCPKAIAPPFGFNLVLSNPNFSTQ